MSQGQKLFERPKVRFSQPSEDSSTNSEKPSEPIHATSNKPRIRSIVTLDDTYKLIYKNGDLPSTSKANVVNTETQYSSKTTCIVPSSSDANFQRLSSSNCLNADSKTLNNKSGSPNVQKSLPCANSSQNRIQKDNSSTDTTACLAAISKGTENSKPVPPAGNTKDFQSTVYKSRLKNFATPVPHEIGTETKSTGQVKTGMIPKPGRVSAYKIGAKHAAPKTVPLTVKKTVKKAVTASNENVLPKNTVSRSRVVSQTNRQREKTPGRGAVPTSSRNLGTAKTISCGLKISKPGSKTWKIRTKTSPVKKTILRDVTGHPTNVYVGPGVARYYSQGFKINMEKEKPHIRPDIVSGDKLGRPEYNSIMCTIDELKKAQAEKFVTDVEHLPSVYRNLVNEKVSAALDFSPDEAIYKNLVDLSVNENQLPSRVTRSKDPEPRHRDIVPRLSDFFTPTYSEEYCTAVQIRPSSPEIFSNWSAFAISDKIFGWKHDMDQCY